MSNIVLSNIEVFPRCPINTQLLLLRTDLYFSLICSFLHKFIMRERERE